ncbi:MAG: hypothetical protein ACRDHF_09285 [Tepidiformaceae bacterium]
MPGWADILGSLASGLPQIAQAGASIYAASRQPRVTVQTAAAPVAPSPYYSPMMIAAPAMGTMLPAIRSAVGVGTGAVAIARAGARALAARIAAFVGRRVSPQQAMALVRRVGPEAAAAALGVTTVELATWLMQSNAMRGRRRRGITGRQISNARSTIRRVSGFMAQIQSACGPARARRRSGGHRAGCGCVVCRRAA